MSASTSQYGRQFSCIIGNDAEAIEVGDVPVDPKNPLGPLTTGLRVVFSVRRGDTQTPNSVDLRIFNLSDTTASKIEGEFTRVALQAGYEGNYGLIFRGNIKQVRRGRENATDSYVDVTAADGDEAYNFASVLTSLAAGSNGGQNQVNLFLQQLAAYNVQRGVMPEFTLNKLPRGVVLYGAVKDELREFAETYDVRWSIQDGKLTFIKRTSFLGGDIPLISPTTGLIGVPEQTQNGLSMRVLLNPSVRIGTLVKLDSTAINRLRYELGSSSVERNLYSQTSGTKLNADGLYYVMRADHIGDTRGNDWYTDLTCLAADATVTTSAIGQAVAQPENATPRY